jgi:hypothetical protein
MQKRMGMQLCVLVPTLALRAAFCPLAPLPLSPPPHSPPLLAPLGSLVQMGMFAIGMVFSLASAVFIALRVRRLRQNLLRSSSDAGAPQAAAKGCHTRAAASVTLSVLAFVLMLVAAITVWVGVLPLGLYYFTETLFCPVAVPSTLVEAAPGAACAGIVIATSFMAMVLDASSHCCCKSAGKGAGGGGGPTVVIVAPGIPQQQQLQQQQMGVASMAQYAPDPYAADPHRASLYKS